MNPEEEKDQKLNEALFTLAVGATVEEIGRDEKGATKVFKRKLAPNLEAIKYLREQRKKKNFKSYIPATLERQDNGND
jgi:hypothetical protein